MAGSRKANGESWISEEPNDRGYYEAKVWIGLKPDGTPDRRHVQRKSLASVRKRVRELERKRDAGTAGRPGKLPTVEQMLTRHLTVVLPGKGRAPRSIADYWSKCRNDIFPRWGGQRIDRLLPEYLEDGYAQMLEEGLSAAHVLKVHRILSSAYAVQARRSGKFGMEGGTVLVNPCDYVDPPAVTAPAKKSLTKKQARAVLATALERGTWARWALGLSCGTRQGETLGLRWDCLDIDVPDGEPGEMRVAWQLQRLTWEHGCADAETRAMRKRGAAADDIEQAAARTRRECAAAHCERVPCNRNCRWRGRECGPPCPDGCERHAVHCPARKLPQGIEPFAGGLALREIKERRRTSVKVIPVPPELCGPLREHRSAQFEAKMLAASEWQDLGMVFCQWNGRPVDPRRDWQEWSDLLEAAGVPHRGVHGGRHTAASLAIEAGTALTVVQEMLGHSDIRVTRGYVETSSPQSRRAAKAMGRALFGEGE
jgi:integrase